MFFVNGVYLLLNFISNFFFYGFTFKLNYESIYVLLSLADFKFFFNFFSIFNFNVIDFYQFIILDFISNCKFFIFELYLNYLNYPVFILFAVLFFLTSFFSLLALSYLGFYGVFMLNFISLFLL